MNEDQEPKEQTQEVPKRFRNYKWLLLLLLALIVGILGWWYLPILQQKMTDHPATPSGQVVHHQQQPQLQPQERESLQHVIKSLASRIAALEKARAMPSVPRAIPKLDVISLPDFQPLFFALRCLEQVAGTAKPFRNELDDILTQVPTLPEALGSDFAKLLALADSGVPTHEQLAQEFDNLVRMLKQPITKQSISAQSTTQNWIGKLKGWLKSLVSIRYNPPQRNSDAQTNSVLERVHELLIQDNLLDILEHKAYLLEEYQNPSIQEWYKNLQNRVLVQQMITELRPLSLTLLMFGALTQNSQQETEE
ncbi:MAG: hypothetical protein ABFQ95_07980 [Pseudomonadota bacterium]